MSDPTHACVSPPARIKALILRARVTLVDRERSAIADERGQSVLLFVGFLSFFVIIALFAINVGVITASRTSAQRAADAAALAGCWYLPDTSTASAKALEYGNTRNGAAAPKIESGNSTVPTFSQFGSIATDTITVTVTRVQGLIGYAGLVGIPSSTISATAVCRKEEGLRPQIIALGTAGGCGDTLVVHGTLNLGADGSAVANCNPTGIELHGSSVVNGRFLVTPSGTVVSLGGATSTAGLMSGSVPDPYAGLTPPQDPPTSSSPNDPAPRPGCQYKKLPTPRNPETCIAAGGTTLMPGIYWGGISFGSGSVNLSPGIYQLAGGGTQGGLTMEDGAIVSGIDVTIFNGRGLAAAPGNADRCGPINIKPGAQLLTTPPANGLILWQSAGCNPPNQNLSGCGNTSSSSDTANLGGATIGVSGVTAGVYLPNAMLCNRPSNCSPPTTMNVLVVAQEFDIGGCMTFSPTIPSGTLYLGPIRLVE